MTLAVATSGGAIEKLRKERGGPNERGSSPRTSEEEREDELVRRFEVLVRVIQPMTKSTWW